MGYTFEIEDSEDISIDQSMIEDCEDIETLNFWYEKMEFKLLKINEFLRSYKDAGIGDDEWLHRTATARAYTSISLKLIERKILKTGSNPPYPPTDSRNKELVVLQNKLSENKKFFKKIIETKNINEELLSEVYRILKYQ